ncbi:MAG: isoprenylcysteine carboxylmethyltransferase family protein [Terriglobales bacterium]
MKATEFEFRYRWWIFSAIFTAGFLAYNLGDPNLVEWLLGWLTNHSGRSWRSDLDFHIAFGVAALLVTAAAAIRTWATAYLGARVMTAREVQSAHLVADGPYRFVRNPLYLGNMLLAIGFGAMASRFGWLVIVVGNALLVYRLIGREEDGLLSNQGDSYRAYFNAVPRLIPSLVPCVPEAGATPRWRQGFVGESMMWAFAVGITAFAITLKLVYFWAALGIALAIGFLVHWIGSSAPSDNRV